MNEMTEAMARTPAEDGREAELPAPQPEAGASPEAAGSSPVAPQEAHHAAPRAEDEDHGDADADADEDDEDDVDGNSHGGDSRAGRRRAAGAAPAAPTPVRFEDVITGRFDAE